jgi:hypothetical protein
VPSPKEDIKKLVEIVGDLLGRALLSWLACALL